MKRTTTQKAVMKLRKKDRQRLELIYDQLKRGLDFVMNESTALMVETSMTSNDVFTSKMSPKKYASINKEIGSEWVLARTALRNLEEALLELNNAK